MEKELYLIKWLDVESPKYETMYHIVGTNSYSWTTGFGIIDIRFPPFSEKSVKNAINDGVFAVIKLN